MVGAALLGGCQAKPEQAEEAEAKADAAPDEAAAQTDDAQPSAEASTGSGEDTSADTGGEAEVVVDLDVTVGVESCDAYAKWWTSCVGEHAPEGDRPDLEAELSEQLAAWKQTVDGGGSAKAVEIGCTTALEAAKAQSKEWGCEP